MPATRPSTRVQRRAQVAAAPSASSRRRRTTAASTTATSAARVETSPAMAATPSASPNITPPDLSEEAMQRIVSAVSQAVIASFGASQPTLPAPPSMEPEQREVPLVVGSDNTHNLADATTMHGPVASALHHITGETGFINVSPSVGSGSAKFCSISVPIDANVSAKVKAKIWAHEFIDFGVLLSSGAGDTRYHLSVSSQGGSSLPALSLEPSHKPKAIPNIEAWTSAFQIFVGVYTAKFPLEAPILMKYGEVVWDLATRGADWRLYDTQFRLLRQSNPAELPWGYTHWELWIRVQTFGHARLSKPQSNMRTSSNNSSLSVAGPFVPRGFCRKFHRGAVCLGCNYKHNCFKCGVVHPAIRCNFRGQKPSSGSAPSATKSRTANTGSN